MSRTIFIDWCKDGLVEYLQSITPNPLIRNSLKLRRQYRNIYPEEFSPCIILDFTNGLVIKCYGSKIPEFFLSAIRQLTIRHEQESGHGEAIPDTQATPYEHYLPIILDGAFNADSQAQKLHSHQVPLLTGAVKNAVIKRDHATCRFCGFRSMKYQQVLISDNNPHDLDTLFTACIFCHQSFNLELVTRQRAGVLIWLPEVDQASLHHIARDLYLARIGQGETADKARKILDLLTKLNKDDESADLPTSRREEVRTRLGTDDPAKLAEQLRDKTKREDPEFTRALSGLRLLPLDRRIIQEMGLEFNQFPQILTYWRSKNGPLSRHKIQGFKWLDYLLKALGLIKESVQTKDSPHAEKKVPVKELSARLLRDAAVFFKTLARNNVEIEEVMLENASVFENIATFRPPDLAEIKLTPV